jgi:hypothetical protein
VYAAIQDANAAIGACLAFISVTLLINKRGKGIEVGGFVTKTELATKPETDL